MRLLLLLSILIASPNSFSQACLQENLVVDPSCSCQAKNNCYKFFSPDYLQAVKKVAGTNPKLVKAVVENQKATTSAFNKIMSNRSVSGQELEAIRKEAALLEKLNQKSLASLNTLRSKNKRPPLNPEKEAKVQEKRILNSLSAEFQKKHRSETQILNNQLGIKQVDEYESLAVDEQETTKQEAAEKDLLEDNPEDENAKIEKQVALESQKDFDYKNEISSEKAKPIFGLISDRYQKVILKKDALPYHVDSEQDKSLKNEIKNDLRQVLELRSKKFD